MQTRTLATQSRRDSILSAALDLFLEDGYEHTTLGDIRRAAGASIGSIYHHFGSKEAIAATLFLQGISDYQSQRIALLSATTTAEEGVKASVEHYLAWVERNPKLAAFMLSVEDRGVQEAVAERLRHLNRHFSSELSAWRRRQTEAGKLRRLPDDVYGHILLGPVKAYVRQWLRGETSTPIGRAGSDFAAAAWNALRADAPSASRPGDLNVAPAEAAEIAAEAWQAAVLSGET